MFGVVEMNTDQLLHFRFVIPFLCDICDSFREIVIIPSVRFGIPSACHHSLCCPPSSCPPKNTEAQYARSSSVLP